MKLVPNILTIFRLFLIPIYLLVFYSSIDNNLWYAIGIFLLASVTDIVDGFIARKFNAITKIGQLLDPLADKLMQLTVLLTLSLDGYIKMWVFWIILGKELLMILSGSILFLSKTKIIISSNIFGKLTTVLIYIAIILSVFKVDIVDYIFMIVITIAI
ncbi:MAG TPA: CDP-diacylglycerol--glycerol-3-phosphate 3-phosphatidyltransferase, partial [Acholeplasmataceae bacterium]|nr:CDP-diacylglycerol--glycerol-3-phosphate 3-phosphatidyltransferase [Acholeplasmataceae bacterium]